MKRQNDREVGAAEQVVGSDQSSQRHAARIARVRDIHDQAKIEMPILEAKDDTVRSLTYERKYPDSFRGSEGVRYRRFETQRRDNAVTQSHQKADPVRRTTENSPRGCGRIQGGVFHVQSVRIDKLGAGKQCFNLSFGRYLVSSHSGDRLILA